MRTPKNDTAANKTAGRAQARPAEARPTAADAVLTPLPGNLARLLPPVRVPLRWQ